MFVDRAKIHCIAGRGGDGMMSFRREKYVEMGGPDGGNGGDGGSVVLLADPQKATLHDVAYRPHFKAEHGTNGGTAHKTGATGEDLIIHLPPGTLAYRDGRLLGDLKKPGDRLLVAKGGKGGRGNASFKTSVNTAPHLSEKGEEGEDAELALELKMLADVGLVGFPNAGKSTFLARVTKARPKIADYPFTTLTPNLGVCAVDGTSFVIADIPGLIEGAHAGKGLGDEFLRHVERTRVLVHLVDASGFGGLDANKLFKALNKELKLYSPTLLKKPQIVVATKQDVTDSDKAFKAFQKKLKKTKIYPISAVTGEGVEAVLRALAKALAKAPEAPLFVPETTEYRIDPNFTVEQDENGRFIVGGKRVAKLVARTHFHQDEGVARLQKILRKMGVEKELQKRGVRTGDKVVMGEFEFTYRPE